LEAPCSLKEENHICDTHWDKV